MSAKIEKICKGCGIKFFSYPSQKRFFHDQKCFSKYHGAQMLGENHPGWKGGVAAVKCAWCGETFKIKKNIVRRGHGKYCDKICFNKWKSKNLRGNKSPAWRGGITPINFEIRNSEKYTEWRISVFERDGFTCQKCGQVRGDIHAHHIKRFSSILREIVNHPIDMEHGLAENKDLWSIENGITLCKKCHKDEHRKTKKGRTK